MFHNGLHTDTRPINQPEGTYRSLKGGTIVEPEGVVSKEPGTRLLATIAPDLVPIGSVSVGDGETVLFLAGETRSVIGRLRGSTWSVVLDDSFFAADNKLGFSESAPVSAVWRSTPQGEGAVYWTDGTNPPRKMDLSRLPALGVEFPLRQISLFPNLDVAPRVHVQSVPPSGGRLPAGAYAYAIALVDQDGTATNWLDVTAPIFVPGNGGKTPDDQTAYTPPIYVPGPGEVPSASVKANEALYKPPSGLGPLGSPYENDRAEGTGRRVVLALEGLDPSYVALRIAALYWPTQRGRDALESPTVEILPDVQIRAEGVYRDGGPISTTVVHTGAEPSVPGDPADVLVPKPSYRTAQTMTAVDDVLYLGGLTDKGEDLGYQRYANNIVLKTVSREVTQDDFRRPTFLLESGGFKRDEVYAFYIAFVLKDGRLSRAYHIPGRPPTSEAERGLLGKSDPAYPAVKGIPGVRKFHVYGEPDETGFAYWENENETYPLHPNSEVWSVSSGKGVWTGGTLAGQKVRHHHFPEYKYSKNTSFNNDTYKTTYRTEGVQLTNFQVPDEIKEQVVGYKLFYAQRNVGNRRIIEQTFMSPVVEKKSSHWPAPEGVDGTYPGDYTFTNRIPGHNAYSAEVFDHERLVSRSFGFVRNQQDMNLSRITFIKAAYTSRGGIGTLGATTPPIDEGVTLIRGVQGGSYIASNTTATKTDFGTFLNPGMEEKVVLKLDRPIAQVTPAGYQPFVPSYVWDVHQFTPDLYLGFDRQRLTACGPIQTDFSATSAAIYGGDTVSTLFRTGLIRARPFDRTGDGSQDVSTPQDGNPYLVWNYHLESGVQTDVWAGQEAWVYESEYNLHFRHDGDEYWETGAPTLATGSVPRWEPSEIPIDAQFRNWLGFNDAFALPDSFRPAFASRALVRAESDYPTRVIRSEKSTTEATADPFRTFKDQDYKDLPSHRGRLVTLRGLTGGLLAHMESGLFVTRGRDELQVGDARAYLGAGDIFAVPPSEPYSSDRGYAGINSPTAGAVTPLGYVWIDRLAGKVFRFTGELDEISSKGMTQFFLENLSPRLGAYGLDPDLLSAPEFRCVVGYDPARYRAVVSWRDLVPSALFVSRIAARTVRWSNARKAFESKGLSKWTPISWTDKAYFEPVQTTMTYLLDRGIWEGEQYYAPDAVVSTRLSFQSVYGGSIYVHDAAPGHVYGEARSLSVRVVSNDKPTLDKNLQSIEIYSRIEDPEGLDLNQTFDEIQVRSERTDSGVVSLDDSNARRTRELWNVSALRDQDVSGGNSQVPQWAKKKRLSGQHFDVTLTVSGSDQEKVYLMGVAARYIPAKR